MECPDCRGYGVIPRPEATEPREGEVFIGAHHSSFPMLCDRCSGSGDVPAGKPACEGDAPIPLP